MVEVFEAIYGRRSIRSFRDEPVPPELIEKVIDAARVAPSGKNRQHWEFVVVLDRVLREKIAVIWANAAKGYFGSLTREQLENEFLLQPEDYKGEKWAAASVSGEAYRYAYGAPVLVVVFISHPEIENNLPSAFMAIQNLLLAAHALGLGAIITRRAVKKREDAELVREILGAPEGYEPVAVIPLGYPAKRPAAIPKRSLEEVLHWNCFGQRSPENCNLSCTHSRGRQTAG